MSRIAWSFLVPFCVVLAVLAVVVIVRDNTKTAPAAASVSGDAVTMEKTAFAPLTLTVARGAHVTFANKDVAPHTVTADDGSSDSGVIEPGKGYTLTVDTSFTYHCTIHPSMKAKIALEG